MKDALGHEPGKFTELGTIGFEKNPVGKPDQGVDGKKAILFGIYPVAVEGNGLALILVKIHVKEG